MRKLLWLAGLTLGLGWASAAHAQIITFGPVVGQITNSKVDYRNVNAPVSASMPYNNGSGNKLSTLFPSLTRMSTTFVAGKSTFPTPAQMQASAPTYFKAFQMYRPQRISP
ncbi:MAG TPA: hypothetical protein VH643_29740 [Gemmataceae bacterium]|jgi:hypothetical protein